MLQTKDRIAECIRKHDSHIMPTRDPSQDKRPTQTESEGLETNIPSKWTGKTAGVAIVISDKIDFKKKGHKERSRRSLHNTQRENRPRRHKHCKYICTQIHKENLGGLQERY